MIYMHLVPRFSTLFQGILFSICSSICSRNAAVSQSETVGPAS